MADDVKLTVALHYGTGRHTLMEKRGAGPAVDLRGPLLGNTDKGKFYRAVAAHIAALAAEGHSVTYVDADDAG